MPRLEWNPSLSVNVAEIDQQHQKLVGMINALYDAMLERKVAEVLEKILAGLIAYVGIHFATEERLFAQVGYPDAVGHKLEHERLTKKVVDFKKRYDSKQIGLTVELSAFLGEWLTTHIAGTDKKYSGYLNAHGVR